MVESLQSSAGIRENIFVTHIVQPCFTHTTQSKERERSQREEEGHTENSSQLTRNRVETHIALVCQIRYCLRLCALEKR